MHILYLCLEIYQLFGYGNKDKNVSRRYCFDIRILKLSWGSFFVLLLIFWQFSLKSWLMPMSLFSSFIVKWYSFKVQIHPEYSFKICFLHVFCYHILLYILPLHIVIDLFFVSFCLFLWCYQFFQELLPCISFNKRI